MDLHVVFQGGGANVVTLMAAANAIQLLEEEEHIQVISVTGVSAGAITACMLASPLNLESYRVRTKEKGSEIIHKFSPSKVHNLKGKIAKYLNGYKLLKQLINGGSILNEQDMIEFYTEVFENHPEGGVKNFGDLVKPTFVTTTDINDNERNVWGSDIEGSPRIVEALADSSALPFVFRNFTSNSSRVDGGIAGNLPVGLLTEKTQTNERILAISFEKESKSFAKNILSYITRLFGASIDGAVVEDIKRIEATGGMVVRLPRLYDVIEFENALNSGLDQHNFKQKTKDFKKLIEEKLDVARKNSHKFISKSEFENKIVKAHTFLENNSTLEKVEKITIMQLAGKHSEKDTVTQEIRYYPDDGGAQVVSAGIACISNDVSTDEDNWEVFDKEGKEIIAERLMVPDPEETNGKKSIFILEREVVKKDGFFSISQTSHGPVFQEFRQYNVDYVSHKPRTKSGTEIVTQVFMIPKSLGEKRDFEIHCLKSTLNLFSELNCELDDAEDIERAFVSGSKMTPKEIRAVLNRNNNATNFHILGWKTHNVPKGKYCGAALCWVSKIPKKHFS